MPNVRERIDRLFASGSFIEPGMFVSTFESPLCTGDIERQFALRYVAIYTAQDVIDPRDTRDGLIRMLEAHRIRLSVGVGEHLTRYSPTGYEQAPGRAHRQRFSAYRRT